MKSLHMNKMDTLLRYMNPWRKRVGGRENKVNLKMDETNNVDEKVRLDLANVEMIGSTWRETRRLKKDWHGNLDYHEGLVFTSEYENTV